MSAWFTTMERRGAVAYWPISAGYWLTSRNQVIGNDILQKVEPDSEIWVSTRPCAESGRQNAVKRRDAIGGDESSRSLSRR